MILKDLARSGKPKRHRPIERQPRPYPAIGKGIAWEIPGPKGKPGIICNWARPNIQQLEEDPKPQIQARTVKIIIISLEELRSLRKAARLAPSAQEAKP